MWLFVLFDLPVETADQRRQYAQFRKKILSMGFAQLQYSVYARHMPSEDAAEHVKTRLMAYLPPEGQVRLLMVTDHQFGKMEVYYGRMRRPAETPPLQISLF
jgi:CRISPR-associated endoribonuclease Cas2